MNKSTGQLVRVPITPSNVQMFDVYKSKMVTRTASEMLMRVWDENPDPLLEPLVRELLPGIWVAAALEPDFDVS